MGDSPEHRVCVYDPAVDRERWRRVPSALFCLISVAVNIFSVPYVYGKLIRAREGRQVVVVCRNETECRHENVTRQGTTSQAPAPDSETGLHLVLLARSSSRLVGMELTVGFLWEVPLDKVEYVRHEKLVDAYAVKLLGWQNEDKDSARARLGGDGAPR